MHCVLKILNLHVIMPLKLVCQGESLQEKRPVVVTTGTFDGVHLGHTRILDRLRERATYYGGVSVVVSFEPHPRQVLFPESPPISMLSTLEEKVALLSERGIDYLVLIPFTRAFSNKTSREFIEQDIVGFLHPVCLVTGYDHHFGKNREGSITDLRLSGEAFGFVVEEIPALDLDQISVSSSIIRNALLRGDIETASRNLGYDYTLSGRVLSGERRGHTLGFPTANLQLMHEHKLIPADGVYACMASCQSGEYKCMVNIGKRPTFNGLSRSIEAHLIGFHGDLYGSEIRLSFIRRIRDEKRFSGAEDLVQQLQRDRISAISMLDR